MKYMLIMRAVDQAKVEQYQHAHSKKSSPRWAYTTRP